MSLIITTNRLWLCTLGPDDAAMVLAYYKRNKDHFKIAMPAYSKDFFTERFHHSTLLLQAEEMSQDKLFKFWLFLKEDGDQIIGDVSISNIIRGPLQAAYLGYKLDNEFEGLGYMQEGLTAIIHFAFSHLKLHRLEANIIPDNHRSIKLIKSLGFNKDGLTEKYLKINGKWADHYRFSLINPAHK